MNAKSNDLEHAKTVLESALLASQEPLPIAELKKLPVDSVAPATSVR